MRKIGTVVSGLLLAAVTAACGEQGDPANPADAPSPSPIASASGGVQPGALGIGTPLTGNQRFYLKSQVSADPVLKVLEDGSYRPCASLAAGGSSFAVFTLHTDPTGCNTILPTAESPWILRQADGNLKFGAAVRVMSGPDAICEPVGVFDLRAEGAIAALKQLFRETPPAAHSQSSPKGWKCVFGTVGTPPKTPK